MRSPRAGRARAVATIALLVALAPAISACGGSSGSGATTHQAARATTTGTATTGTTAGGSQAGTTGTSASATGHTIFCGTVPGRAWSTNGKSGTSWDVSAMGVACATATHWAAVLSTADTQVLAGPAGYNCHAQVTGSSTPPVAGSRLSAAGAGNFTWQAAAY